MSTSRTDHRARRRPMRRWLLLGLAVALPLRPAGAAVDQDAVARLQTLLSAVGAEYRESLDATGALVRPLEYEEARSFFAEARQRWAQLDLAGPAAAPQPLADLGAAIDGRAPVTTVLAQLDAVRAQLRAATGIGEVMDPPAPPSAGRGAALFREHCAACHGERGDGGGPEAPRLDPKPANFTDPAFMRGETPEDFFHIITLGKRGAAMPAWEDILTVQERWDVISYLWRFSRSDGQFAEGQGVYLSQCASCHGATGDGRGPYAARPVADITPPSRLARRSDAELFAAVRDGVSGTAMPAFRTLSDDERWKAVAFLRLLSLGGPDGGGGGTGAGGHGATPPTAAGPPAAAPGALADTRRLLAAALAAYQRDDPQALAWVSDAYFQFEPLEKSLAVSAPDLTHRVEARFLELRGIVATPGAVDQAAAVAAAITADLAAAERALQPHASRLALFVESATIILREGFEVVLIITALLASVKKSGHPQMQRPIVMGMASGVALSLVTAYAFAQFFRGASAAAADALGGVTMLVAAAVLFWVSYWLVSKAEADKWQRFIQGKVKTALSTGSSLALAGAAFLAVLREGVETVLFYEAIFGAAPGAAGTAVGGLIAGSVVLVVVSVVLVRFGMRLPIRPFFLGTSFLLYYMAIVFAGKGVAELQETGWIAVTPVAGLPRVDTLGLYPTIETLLAQAIFLALLLYAAVVILRRHRAAAGRQPAEVGTRTAQTPAEA